MKPDPLLHTLAAVLDELRRAPRARALGELVESAAWWLDVRSGTTCTASTWALPPAELSVDRARLAEAPYLASIGYLAAMEQIDADATIADAATRVLRRAPHTIERTGYADDPLVLGGLLLLGRRLDRDTTVLREEAGKTVSSADIPTSIAGLLTLIEPSLAANCRPYTAKDPVDAVIAIVIVAADQGLGSRLFPSVDLGAVRSQLMATACSGALSPTSELERAFAAIALTNTIATATGSARIPEPAAALSEEVDVAIIVALKEEFRHLHTWIPDAKPVELGGHQYYRAKVGEYSLVTAFVGDMGPVPAAVASARLIERWRPRNVVLLGIAGGVSKDVALGDVVVGAQVDSYLDAGKAIDEEHAFTLLPSGAVFRGDRQLVSRVRNLEFAHADLFRRWRESCRVRCAGDTTLVKLGELPAHAQLHDGLIASGPLVGASDKFQSWLLRRDRGYKAIEMEGGAVMWAAEQAWDPPRTLVVRGISDRADPAKAALDDLGKGAVRAWAMQNAIAFVWALMDARLLQS